jgi:hypothetical protein
VEIALACGRLDMASSHTLFTVLPIYKWRDAFSDGAFSDGCFLITEFGR